MKNITEGKHDFRNDGDSEKFLNEKAWALECTKVGMADAGSIRPGGTIEEMHGKRKAVRRACNAMSKNDKYGEVTEDQGRAGIHASQLIAGLDGLLEGLEGAHASTSSGGVDWRDSKGRALKQLRTMSDFQAHYGSKSGSENIELVDFFRGVANMPTTQAVRNALTEGTNSAGGFTLPNVVMPQILGALVPASSLLSAGMPIVPLDGGAKTYTTAIMSGVPTAAWRLEGGTVAESDPVFSGAVAAPQSLSFFFKISRELFNDSPNIQQVLLSAIGLAMAKELDRAGLRGTGTAPQPRGVLNTAGIQPVTNGANGATLASYANLFSGAQALLQADAPMPTAAIMSPRSLIKLGGLADTTNQPLMVPSMLQPVKLLSTSQIPNNLTVGTSTDCSEIFMGDFTKMAMMLRESLSVQLLTELFAGNGQLAFMCHCRADFAVMYPSAFAVITGIRP